MNFSKCSIGLHTRINDKRNFLANYSYYLDQQQIVQYTQVDDYKKCEIFGITKNNIDFTTQKKMSGCGEHYYPLAKDFKKKKRIGSDSGWNRIPVSGSNHKYKLNYDNINKVNKWLEYCNRRGATLYYELSEKQVDFINEEFKKLEEQHKQIFEKLIRLK
mgnify:CR=1 FL=1